MLEKYIITYEIKDKTRDLSGLYNTIKDLGVWLHYIDATWIVKNTNNSSQQIYEKLKLFFRTEDRLLIIKIDPTQKYGWLPADAWTWLDT